MKTIITPSELEATKEVIYALRKASLVYAQKVMELHVLHFNELHAGDARTSTIVRDICDSLEIVASLADDLVLRVKTPTEAESCKP